VPVSTDLDLLCINTIRTLSMDGVQAAESGHPGTPMALAPLAYVLYTRHMKHNPSDPNWPDRDRFVLSCGHASMLLYSTLYLMGYGLTLDDLRNFRQWQSRTPGHPEHGHTPGVETTTGPLGQGFSNAVGMAMAEAHLAATFNREGHPVVDHWTYMICSDGDLMEGISHEAASFAGHYRLGRLIAFYDDNRITIDGSTDLAFTDDTGRRFEAYGWHVQHVSDVNDLDALDAAIAAAKADTHRPSLIICRTHIGYGSPNRQDTAKAHGEALGEEEVKLTKQAYDWPSMEPFFVPDDALEHCRSIGAIGAAAQDEWRKRLIEFTRAEPELAKEFGRRMQGDLPTGWEKLIPVFSAENGAVATRAASGVVLGALVEKIPELVGGSADLTPSNNTKAKAFVEFAPGAYDGRYVHYGVREHGMAGIMNGLALHGGVVPYAGTFLIFSDYMRPSVRLAALMGQHVIYVYTHDSVGLGEDGPTHQPVEQLSSLRAIPGLTVVRPGDANETGEAWRLALKHRHGPVALALTRQKLPFIDRSEFAGADGVARGAYVLTKDGDAAPEVVIIATGSEVSLAVGAHKELTRAGIRARVVSMPSQEVFAAQDEGYRDSVLPPGIPRVAVEAGHPMSWYRWVGDTGTVIGIDHYGASAPYKTVFEAFGFTVAHVTAAAHALVGR
jgi:transketolase